METLKDIVRFYALAWIRAVGVLLIYNVLIVIEPQLSGINNTLILAASIILSFFTTEIIDYDQIITESEDHKIAVVQEIRNDAKTLIWNVIFIIIGILQIRIASLFF